MPVHPRPRGEHPPAVTHQRVLYGSSPPARGTREPVVRSCYSLRFIPARAGNTARPAPARCTTAVHPRPRGEHEALALAPGEPDGSSPPARGTPRPARPAVRGIRFIPARAGNTSPSGQLLGHVPVHPRPRGEHSFVSSSFSLFGGSSPPARGTRSTGHPLVPAYRFIPAQRGEHTRAMQMSIGITGSSPPARGTRVWRRCPL